MLKFTLKPGDGGVDKILRCVKKVFDIFNVQGVKKEVFKDDVRSSKGVERCFNGVIGVLTILGLQPRFGLKPLKVLVVCAQSGNAVCLVRAKRSWRHVGGVFHVLNGLRGALHVFHALEGY